MTQQYDEQGDKISANLCFGLPTDKNQREGYVQRLKEEVKEEGGSIDNYICKSEHYFKNLIMVICVYSLLLL